MEDAKDFTPSESEREQRAEVSAEDTSAACETEQTSQASSHEEAADGSTQEETPSESEVVAQAQEEVAEWQDKYMRLHAEWDTYRRRMNEQRDEERKRATEGLVCDLLPVLDDFERSIEYALKNGEGDLLVGVQKVHTKLVDVLIKGGVEVIDPAGEAFDALEAQAVATVERSDVFDETVQDVYQKGYRMGKKVLRPAMVTVTSGGPKRQTEDAQSASEE